MPIVHEGPIPLLEPGQYPAELVQVCQMFAVEPGALLSWAVTSSGVAVIMPSGVKLRVDIKGKWRRFAADQQVSTEEGSCREPKPPPDYPHCSRQVDETGQQVGIRRERKPKPGPVEEAAVVELPEIAEKPKARKK